VAATVVEYAAPTVAPGSGEEVVIVRFDATDREKVFVAELITESTTSTTIVSVSAFCGVPLITPVDELIADHEPVSGVLVPILHAYAGVPPAAVIVVLYATPVVAAGNGEEVGMLSVGTRNRFDTITFGMISSQRLS
jgi:hypothetical protein